MKKAIYISDCEGPLTKDDNAFDITSHFLEGGDRLFILLSSFDDYLGYVEKVEDYRLGSTLLYVLPFLKAQGFRDRDLREFSEKKVTLMPGARQAVEMIKSLMGVYIVSTSYVHYAEAVSRLFGIPAEHLFSTEVSLDACELSEKEAKFIRAQQQIFLNLPKIEWEEGRKSKEVDRAVRMLKEFFFVRLREMQIYRWLSSIKIMGGKEKREAIRTICEKEAVGLEGAIYVGDSITDMEALEFVRQGGGLSVSFNGNRYAVFSAEFLVIAEDARLMGELVRRFIEGGKEAIQEGKLEGGLILRRREEILSQVSALSEKQRKEVRGEQVGMLG